MQIQQRIRLAKDLGVPRDAVTKFIGLSGKLPIKNVLDLDKILSKLDLNDASKDTILERYILLHGNIPAISSNSNVSRGKNVANTVSSSRKVSGQKRSLSGARSVSAPRAPSRAPSSGPSHVMPVAPIIPVVPMAPKKKIRSGAPRFKSLKQVLDSGNLSRNRFHALVANDPSNHASKVRKSLETLPASLDRAILPHAFLNAFHHDKSKRAKFGSANALVNAAIKDHRTAKMLGEALNVKLPEKLLPVHRQKLHYAAFRAAPGLKQPSFNEPVAKARGRPAKDPNTLPTAKRVKGDPWAQLAEMLAEHARSSAEEASIEANLRSNKAKMYSPVKRMELETLLFETGMRSVTAMTKMDKLVRKLGNIPAPTNAAAKNLERANKILREALGAGTEVARMMSKENAMRKTGANLRNAPLTRAPSGSVSKTHNSSSQSTASGPEGTYSSFGGSATKTSSSGRAGSVTKTRSGGRTGSVTKTPSGRTASGQRSANGSVGIVHGRSGIRQWSNNANSGLTPGGGIRWKSGVYPNAGSGRAL